MINKIEQAKKLLNHFCSHIDRKINVMEVCGTHTVSLFRNGIHQILPENLKLLSGPGCPVCVTDQSYIDNALLLAGDPDNIIATYGDMIRVPGSSGSLETNNTHGNIKIVLSSLDALNIAKNNPAKKVIFLAVGFETTTPATAVAISTAKLGQINNFYIMSAHKKTLAAMLALLSNKNFNIDAFLCPGHVSVITGYSAFTQIVENFKKPCVVAGFEPIQILQGLAEIAHQISTQNFQVKSVYQAVVSGDGNKKAMDLINQYFQLDDGYWRGIGKIEKSAFNLREEFSSFDAVKKFNLKTTPKITQNPCRCGDVLCGLIDPPGCPLFAKTCTPQTAVGPCMVSSEGSCAAWYKYNRNRISGAI